MSNKALYDGNTKDFEVGLTGVKRLYYMIQSGLVTDSSTVSHRLLTAGTSLCRRAASCPHQMDQSPNSSLYRCIDFRPCNAEMKCVSVFDCQKFVTASSRP